MDKKILITIIFVLVIILIAGYFGYQYFSNMGTKVDNAVGETNIENNTPQVEVTTEGVKAEATNGGGTLTICVDKCGDNICQTTDIECSKDNDLNCVCLESLQECPQDCK